MKIISITLLAISAAVIAANPEPETETESSGMNLRGSASSIQDFVSYIKAQYSDGKDHEFLEDTAERIPGTTCRGEGSGCYIYDTVRPCCSGVCNRANSFTLFGFCASAAAVENVDELIDTTESDAKDKVDKAGMVDAQKFLEESEEASAGTTYCRGNDSACYTYNSHFCCSGVCIRHQSGSPFGYCAPGAAVENAEEFMDTIKSKAEAGSATANSSNNLKYLEETQAATLSKAIVEDQQFLEDTEEEGTTCRASGTPCYRYDTIRPCCSGTCNLSGYQFGRCA